MVPKRLKEAREAAGLSQEKLSELIGIEGVNTRSRLSNYEVGRFSPPFDFVLRVAKVLDYPENYFYTVDDDFAKTVLQIYRNRTNPDVNPYYNSLVEAKKLAHQLNECLKKATD
ncbi:helix-turn-helix transcriptional regulator [Yersinia enterocolitica]|uniref:helix-turn-helix domain-containing protein n=1 Tax=Yersinia enterocolitica TaxID=630 RepID=UPI002A11F332|nr:XRE family transcriptional regulator [Yersinia enterocolitica]EKN6284685.1 XRE family transcriptional regulator [Yersinia enterocolitica]ELY5205366.1 helix-turn-helix transcriptional regulator [Yersinia enterocolitica]